MILTSSGKVYVQRRSHNKSENAGLYDKTIGGHVKAGQTWELTVVQECHEELGFPAVVLTDSEFDQAINATNLSIIGLLKKVEHIPTFVSVRKTKDGKEFKQPQICNFYIGYYDGGIRFCDGESVGVEAFTIQELKKRMQEYPKEFAEDLKFMIQRFENKLLPLDELEPEEVLGYEE